jgi:hypothetical protein
MSTSAPEPEHERPEPEPEPEEPETMPGEPETMPEEEGAAVTPPDPARCPKNRMSWRPNRKARGRRGVARRR